MSPRDQGIVTAFVDQVARDKANQAAADAEKALERMEGHEDLCAMRYGNINDTLTTIKHILGWAGTTIFGLLVATLGWLIVQQIDRSNDDTAVLHAQIELLKQQVPATTGSTAR